MFMTGDELQLILDHEERKIKEIEERAKRHNLILDPSSIKHLRMGYRVEALLNLAITKEQNKREPVEAELEVINR